MSSIFLGVGLVGHKRFKERYVFGCCVLDRSLGDVFFGFEVEVQIPSFNSGFRAYVIDARLGVTCFLNSRLAVSMILPLVISPLVVTVVESPVYNI